MHDTISRRSNRTKLALIICLCTVIGALNIHQLIIYKVFNYSILRQFYYNQIEYFFTFPFFVTNSNIYETYYSYETKSELVSKSAAYLALVCLNFLVNDLFVFALFTLADVMLIRGLKRLISQKKSVLTNLIIGTRINKNQIRELEEMEEKILKVIVANTCILMCIKLLDLFFTVSKFKIWKKDLTNIYYYTKLDHFCYTVKICAVYEELVKILYLITYSYSTMLFYYLNKNFRTYF